MRISFIAFVGLIAVVLSCSLDKLRGVNYDFHGITEISYTEDASRADGSSFYDRDTFRSSGDVERTRKDIKSGGPVAEDTHTHGHIAPEEFAKLTDAIIKNHFLSKPDLVGKKSRRYITVTSDKGTVSVDLDSGIDSDTAAVLIAISGVKATFR
ncbi:MAG: hypothetical protein ABI999_08170 [Acidobacteriota bacterium]